MNLIRKVKWALPLALMMVLVTTIVAFAITITVDGVREAAWDGDGSQTPGSQTDPNKSGIDDRYDIEEIQWTNDSTGGTAPYGYMYLLVKTYANFDANFPPGQPWVLFCIDVDDDTGTGTTASGYCNNMPGVDRRVYAYLWSMSATVQRWNGTNWQTVFGGTRDVAWSDSGGDGVADTPYIEVGIDLQSLGIVNSSTCLAAMPSAVYYDNGVTDGEDVTPDLGTFDLSCGDDPSNPTAISLTNLEAQNNTTLMIIASALLLVLISGGAVLAYKRSRT